MNNLEFSPDKIIWSADASPERIINIIGQRVLPRGTIIKLDRLFFEEHQNRRIIDVCQEEYGYPVFVDAKIIEIPDKCIDIAKIYLKHKPFMLSIMASACSTNVWDPTRKDRDTLLRFSEACQEAGTKSCVVTVLTSKTDATCNREFGEDAIIEVLNYAAMATNSGCTDIVCSAKEAEIIKKTRQLSGLSINTPGIRLPNSNQDDQARVLTPKEALKLGATRIIIGRNLSNGDIRENYERIVENITA